MKPKLYSGIHFEYKDIWKEQTREVVSAQICFHNQDWSCQCVGSVIGLYEFMLQ